MRLTTKGGSRDRQHVAQGGKDMHCRRARLAAHFARSAPGVRRHGSRLNSSGVCSGSAVNKRRRFNGHRESAAHLQCRPTRLEARATEQCARDMPATRLASACDCERLLASSSYVGHVDGCRAKPPESPASAHLAVLALPPAGRAPRCRPGPPDASRRGGGGGCSEGSAGLGRARGKVDADAALQKWTGDCLAPESRGL